MRSEGSPIRTQHGGGLTNSKLVRASFANTIGTIATFMLGFVVPPALVRWMAPGQYSAFIIANRVGAFFAILNLGVQIATTKRLSISLATETPAQTSEVLAHATYRTRNAAIAGLLLVPLPTKFLHSFFPQLPNSVVSQTRLAIALFVASSLAALLLVPHYSLLVAAHRLGRSVAFQVSVRVLTGICLVVLAKAGVGVAGMAAMTGAGTIGVALGTRASARHAFPSITTPLFGRRSKTDRKSVV